MGPSGQLISFKALFLIDLALLFLPGIANTLCLTVPKNRQTIDISYQYQGLAPLLIRCGWGRKKVLLFIQEKEKKKRREKKEQGFYLYKSTEDKNTSAV